MNPGGSVGNPSLENEVQNSRPANLTPAAANESIARLTSSA